MKCHRWSNVKIVEHPKLERSEDVKHHRWRAKIVRHHIIILTPYAITSTQSPFEFSEAS